MPQPATPSVALDRRLKRAVVWVTAIAFLSLLALRGYDWWDGRNRALQEGERRAASLADMLSAHLREAFAAADTTLRQLAVYNRQIGGPTGPAEKWQPLLGVSRTQRNGLGSVSVIDGQGTIRHSTVANIVGSSRRDQYVFRRLSAQDRDMLVADTPFRSVTDPSIMLLPLGRRLTTEAGTFQGAIVATFMPGHLRNFFATVEIGGRGNIWVFHPEGAVLFHVPSSHDPMGDTAGDNPLFEQTRGLSAPHSVRLPATVSAPAAIAAIHPVGEPRIFVAVSLDQSELLADWRRSIVFDVIVIAVLAVVFAAMLVVIFRQIDGRSQAEQALARSQRLEAIGQLTGGVAHDFNNLLTVIMMNVSVLKLARADAGGGASGEPVRQIEGAAKHAAALTQQLLTFARKQPLQPRHVDLNAVLHDMQPMLERLLGEAITLQFALAREGCPVRIDPVQLETAVLNLCLNARDAMPHGGPLRLETSRVSLTKADLPPGSDAQPGNYVQLTVIDQGAGIAPEHLSRIFEPFFTTKPVGKGTGLGLSMVYGFVQQSGGLIRVQSQPGAGATVRIHFPVSIPTRAAAAAATEVAPLSVALHPPGRGEIVLLLEDEAVVRQVAEMMLRKLGYHVVSAKDGPEALTVARSLPRIDLLLTDVILPGGMNGREVADQLARERPGLRILFASGYAEESLLQRGRNEPPPRFIAKPYDLNQLAKAIQAALAEGS